MKVYVNNAGRQKGVFKVKGKTKNKQFGHHLGHCIRGIVPKGEE